MARNIFLKIDGIKGESNVVNHPSAIEVVSWSSGVSEVLISPIGAGIVREKRNVGDFVIAKALDKA